MEQARAADAPDLAGAEGLLAAIARLSAALEQETRDAKEGRRSGFETLHERKCEGLFDLIRLKPALAAIRGSSTVREALRGLCGALEENRRQLGFRVAAARLVSDVIADAVRRSHSDGTYGARDWGA